VGEPHTYGQYCPVARASEILAMRWTPIIVRNMLLGCETFSEIREGAPGIPKSLLVQRLRMLETYDVVERTPAPNGRGSRYVLTEAGRELEPVVDAMGDWGARWLDIAPHHIDAGVVLWGMCKGIDPEELPENRVVVRFELPDLPERRMWIVAQPPAAEVCVTPPGYEEDLVVRTDTETLADWHLGRISLVQATKTGRMKVEGLSYLIRELSRWGMRGLAGYPPPARKKGRTGSAGTPVRA
jgi:DNA-binding HxlR family transcriptional regulator